MQNIVEYFHVNNGFDKRWNRSYMRIVCISSVGLAFVVASVFVLLGFDHSRQVKSNTVTSNITSQRPGKC